MNPAAFACNTYAYTITHSALDCLMHLSELGFREFELMMYPGHLWPPEEEAAARRELRRRIDALGARVTTLNMPSVDMNVAGASPEVRAYTLDLLEGIIDLASDLSVPGIVIGPGKANPLFPAPKERLIGYFFTALDRLLPHAERAGTALWLENMPFTFLPHVDEMMAVLARYGHDGIGVVFDAANSHFAGEDLGAALQACAPRLKLVHLSDTGGQVYRHDPVGLGDVPFATLPAALAAVGYSARLMLEIISHDADRDILDSARRLGVMGLGRA